MRASELLNESVTFSVAKLVDHDGHKYYTDPFETMEDATCWVCDGSGKESYGGYTDPETKEEIPKTHYDCGMCKGSGKIKEPKTPYQTLNVANGNLPAILEMLGLDPDDNGVINHADIPGFKRRLIQLKNGDISAHTSDTTMTQSPARAYKDDDGMDRIRPGGKMYTMGRSYGQVARYIDVLLNLFDFAQKNDCDVMWC